MRRLSADIACQMGRSAERRSHKYANVNHVVTQSGTEFRNITSCYPAKHIVNEREERFIHLTKLNPRSLEAWRLHTGAP